MNTCLTTYFHQCITSISIYRVLIFTKDTIREVETYIRLLWSDPALFLTSKEYKWWAIQKKIFHMASRSPFYLDHWTVFQLWLFYIMHYSDPEKMNISLLATNHQVCELFYELLKCNILSSLEQEEAKSAKSFRPASCKKSIRKNNSTRKYF